MRLKRENVSALTYLLASLTALVPLSVDGVVPAFPATARAYGVGIVAVQSLLSTFLLGAAAGQLVWGPLSDRFGRRLSLLLGLVVFMGGTLLCLIAPSLSVLLIGRFLQALGASSGMVVARAVVRDWYAAERAVRIFSTLTGALSSHRRSARSWAVTPPTCSAGRECTSSS